MTQRIAGPGLGLPLPQNLYPTQLYNAPPDANNNRLALAPGDTLPIPAGDWLINTGQYCVIQFLDPITHTWNMGTNAAWLGGHQFVVSDGFNVRVANLLGCPVTASITSYGSAYVQASTTIVATPGNSTWVPIIGGQLTRLSSRRARVMAWLRKFSSRLRLRPRTTRTASAVSKRRLGPISRLAH